MPSRAPRLALILAAVLAAVVAFTVLRPEERSTAVDARGEADPPTAAASPAEEPGSRRKPAAEPPVLTAARPRTLTARRGERVTFRVRHPSAEELHVHGYDIARELPAGRTVPVSLRADLEGIFEIELERSHTPLGRLRVEP